jgi:ubiquinone/menaquinone biosynthesis C-methylase UbiE
MVSKEEVLKANIEVHTKLVPRYNEEPHYKSENLERVSNILKDLQLRTGGESLLDLGCGTGFVIDLAKTFFKNIVGIDATPAMLERVNTNSKIGTIRILEGNCESIPFPNNSFDVCTAYAVLHYLKDIKDTLAEAYRVLKPGGIFYSDLDPNEPFWESIRQLPKGKHYSDIIEREIQAVAGEVFETKGDLGISKEEYSTSEYAKFQDGGINTRRLSKDLKEAGFSSFSINYTWFLGEGKVTHDPKTSSHIKEFQDYMQALLPLSEHLFKSISIIAVK